MREIQPLKRSNKKYIEVKNTNVIKTVLNLIDNLIGGKRFGELNSNKQMYLLNCQSRIEEMLQGNYTEDDLIFLNDTIDSLINTLMAAKSEIKFYIKENLD